MTSVIRFLILAEPVVGRLSITALAQTSTVIPDTEAAQYVGQHITVEGFVVKVFTSKNGNTLLNPGAAYPAQSACPWRPVKSRQLLTAGAFSCAVLGRAPLLP
jgi:hypothetical protein